MWVWSGWKLWLKFLVTIVPLVCILLFLAVLVGFAVIGGGSGGIFEVNGVSMEPEYPQGARVATVDVPNTISLRRGSVVILDAPDGEVIKRIVGLPGESIGLENGKITINQGIIDESAYIPVDVITEGRDYLAEGSSIKIPNGYYFVLGDNRPNSIDSRNFGFIQKEKISKLVTTAPLN